ncbi:MAG: nicotinate-nucleotide--dimethylbenzimidazole phosphoribosyltransferase [Deltaproteobacteria bacterium HGW-Deltaproteobacteria-11]|nr:MAG: nicotinate-nucleotide--dimethylbenzimidazole phosphoribosyltransferase [Deltaproteobacteria bacterium HGW-Deltaproteobacteria-11]
MFSHRGGVKRIIKRSLFVTLLETTINKIRPADVSVRHQARTRLEQLTMPHWALGRIMDLAEDLAAMTGSLHPPVTRKTVATMAGDHGVTAQGVSKYPQAVTAQMVYNFVQGGAGINALARLAGAKVVVVDMGVASDLTALSASGKIISKQIAAGTKDMAIGPAMSREEAVRCVEAGIEVALALVDSTDLFATGDMGIGNTTPSSAIVSVFSGVSVAEVTGRGTGIEEEQFLHKIHIIEQALRVNRPDPSDALDVLAKVGGFEIGGIAGLILGAASLRRPVLIDGFISTAGALIAAHLSPTARDYMIASHRSLEQGHRIALSHLGKKPLLDLDLRLGEGTGAALAMNLVEAAVRILTEVATFEEAAVSKASS